MDKIKLNKRYWEEGKRYFGRNLKSFKIAKVIERKGDIFFTDSKSVPIINKCFVEIIK